MEDRNKLPLINPPFVGIPPASGAKWRDKAGFVYEMIEREPHVNRDGTNSWLLHIRGTCAECGTLWVFKQGPGRKTLPRRCPPHAAGKGREKTYPWGHAPTGGGLPDWRIVDRFMAELGRHVDDLEDAAKAEGRDTAILVRAYDLVHDFFLSRYPEALDAEDDVSEADLLD